jgi:hypothetical protein
MSIAVLDRTDSRQTIYLSTDGAGTAPLEFFRTLPAKSVIVADDNEPSGNLMALHVMEQLPNSVRRLPKTTDWNEELKNTFNLESMRRQPQPSQQQEPEQKQGRELSL